MSDFDAYYEWLEIEPEEQPPSHYRLLDIQPFEGDADVINDAADRLSAHVRQYQLSRHSKLSQKLLNEIAAARVCLIKPKAKEKYDRTLRTAKERPPSSQPPPLNPQSKKPATSIKELLPAVPMSAPTPPEIEQLPDLESPDLLSVSLQPVALQPLEPQPSVLQPIEPQPQQTVQPVKPHGAAPAKPHDKPSRLSPAVWWGIGVGVLLL